VIVMDKNKVSAKKSW